MKEEKGPLIFLIIFAVLTIVFGVMGYMNHKAMAPDPGTESPDEKIVKLRGKIQSLESDAAKYRSLAEQYRADIAQQEAVISFNEDLRDTYESAYKRRLKLIELGDSFDKAAQELDASVSKLKNETLNNLNTDISRDREKTEKDLAEKSTTKDGSIGRLRQIKDEFETDTKRLRQVKNYTQSSLDEAKSTLGDLTQREVERPNIFNEPDGKVILADPVHNTIIINLGTSQGVKNGYRFECFAVRPGNVHVTKGYIEVRHAGPAQSECLIVKRPVALPKDPLSDYVASQPEELISPRQESGRKGYSAQALSAVPKSVILGMNPSDPIVEGDFIQNPFIAPDKALTFYIAGSKEIVNERQKSAIQYKWTEIKSVIESYGSKVATAIDINVNYMVAQKNAKTDDPEFQKGVDLGIPVIYEWELFRFLDAH